MTTEEQAEAKGKEQTTSPAKNGTDTNGAVVETAGTAVAIEQEDKSGKSDADATSDNSTKSDPSKEETSADGSKPQANGEAKKPKKPKPRVLRTQQHGIYTISIMERSNFIVQWKKALLATYPYLGRLAKEYWRLSPARSMILISAYACETIIPSASIYVRKVYLDEVQKAATSASVDTRKLVGMAVADIILEVFSHLVDVVKFASHVVG
jgi:hypothetical protein